MSLYFTGQTIIDGGKMNDFVLTDGGAFSLSCWMYPQGYGGGAQGRIIERGISTFFNMRNTGALRFQVFSSSGTSLNRDAMTGSVNLNVWSNVIVRWNGASVADQCSIFVSGKEVEYSKAQNGTFLRDNAGDRVYLGNTPVGLIRSFHGFMEEIYCWNGILTDSEILLLANSKMRGIGLNIQRTKLQTYYPCDQYGIGQRLTTGNRINDYSLYNNYGTPSGNVSGAAGAILSYHG